jgi:dihydroneopterin aldolase
MQIEIRDMNIPMRIGILPEERLGPQMVVIDAKVAFRPSSEEDRLSSVVDTRQVCVSRLLKVASASHYDLQETFVPCGMR